MFIVDHSVKEGADPTRIISRRMQFVEIHPQGHAINAGWAPHLDLEPLSAADMALIQDVLAAPWIAKDLEHLALTPVVGNSITVKFTVSYRRISMDEFGFVWTTKNPQALVHTGFLDFFGLFWTFNWWRRRESTTSTTQRCFPLIFQSF
jgi:hypothetical protein